MIAAQRLDPRLTFLILTKDEEASIEELIRGLERFCHTRHLAFDVVLSDDSRDRTVEKAQLLGARVVGGGGRGLGGAYLNGLKACVELPAERIVVLDGDGQADLDDLPRFLSTMEESGADLVTGSRFLGRAAIAYQYPPVNRVGVWLLSQYLSLVTGQSFTDSHGGLRLLTKRLARSQQIWGRHTYVQESLVDAVEKGFTVVEVPCNWRARRQGSSKVVASIPRYVARTLPFLLQRAVRRLLT